MTNPSPVALGRLTIIGPGRLGMALAEALAQRGLSVNGPLGRDAWPDAFPAGDIVMLSVPDAEVAGLAGRIPIGPLVGHCAGSLTLDVLGPHAGFSMHPLISASGRDTRFDGAAAAIAGKSTRALAVAREIALRLGMSPIEIDEADRVRYHAAAVLASNYLVALEEAAAGVGAGIGLERRHLARLAQSALDNWARDGARALTGPVARGDEAVVARQRTALITSHSSLLPLWDALTARARDIAAEPRR